MVNSIQYIRALKSRSFPRNGYSFYRGYFAPEWNILDSSRLFLHIHGHQSLARIILQGRRLEGDPDAVQTLNSHFFFPLLCYLTVVLEEEETTRHVKDLA